MGKTIAISLGTNIGQRIENLQRAILFVEEFSVVLKNQSCMKHLHGVTLQKLFFKYGYNFGKRFSPNLF